jgi:hypothetical protein
MIQFVKDLLFGDPGFSMSLVAAFAAAGSGIWSIEWLAFVAAGSAAGAATYSKRGNPIPRQ